MPHILLNFWRICLFKIGPQDLDYSHGLLARVLFINCLLSGLYMAFSEPVWQAALQTLSLLLILMLLMLLVLRVFRKTERFPQTMLAISGTDILLSLLAYAMLGLGKLVPAWQHQVALLGWPVLMIWATVIFGHIYRHALETSIMIGVLIAIALMVASNGCLSFILQLMAA